MAGRMDRLAHLFRSGKTLHGLIAGLVVANAASVLFFRTVISLDGPMHVLHACVLKAHLFSGRYATAAVDYLVNPGTRDLSDLWLIPFTWVFSPAGAHAAYMGSVLLILGMGAWCCARAAGMKDPLLFVIVLPVLFSYVLLLGFFTFLIAAGMALLFLAWWMGRRRIAPRTLCIALILLLIAQGMHRAGGPLAVLFAGCHEIVFRIRDRAGWSARWSMIPRMARIAVIGGSAGIALWKGLAMLFMRWDLQIASHSASWPGAFVLRPLLLFGLEHDRPFLLLLGMIVTGFLVLAAIHRARARSTPVSADALLLAGLLLLLASHLLITPNARNLMLDVRLQSVALIVLMAWAAATLSAWSWSRIVCTGVLVVHVLRMAYIERTMAGSRQTVERIEAVVERLPLHGVTLPVLRDDNWLHAHLSAFAAAAYEGVFFSPHDHLGFTYAQPDPPLHLQRYSQGLQMDLPWLDRHVAAGSPPIIDHVVLFGHGRALDAKAPTIQRVLDRHFFLQWSNGYAEVWARITDRSEQARNAGAPGGPPRTTGLQ